MILTYKLKHGRDFTDELRRARKVAEYAVRSRARSSKDVKHLGLKSAISNQILKKYARNKRIKEVHNVVLTVPGQSVQIDKQSQTIRIPCLKFVLSYMFPNGFEKINQIELDRTYAYVSVTVPEQPLYEPKNFIGIDRNTTGHCVVVVDPETGKVWKFGKEAEHVHKKYSRIRRNLQKKGCYRRSQTVKKRESNIMRNLNHKISKEVVKIAKEKKAGIKLEDLKGIRKSSRKKNKSFRYSLNSWSFYQLEEFIAYKARLQGVPVVYVEPYMTSQRCSRCGNMGDRNGKKFECPSCGHVENSDVNASFNIALSPPSVEKDSRLHTDRDVCKGSTDTPRDGSSKNDTDRRTPRSLAVGVCQGAEVLRCHDKVPKTINTTRT